MWSQLGGLPGSTARGRADGLLLSCSWPRVRSDTGPPAPLLEWCASPRWLSSFLVLPLRLPSISPFRTGTSASLHGRLASSFLSSAFLEVETSVACKCREMSLLGARHFLRQGRRPGVSPRIWTERFCKLDLKLRTVLLRSRLHAE